jgi:molecular chaperone GrpE
VSRIFDQPEDELKDKAEDESEKLEIEFESQEAEIEKAQRLAREYLDSLQRLKAEFDNYRKRIEKEKSAIRDMNQSSVLESLLPTLDAFEGAMRNLEKTSLNDLRDGMRLLHDGLCAALQKIGLEKLVVIDQPFDPAVCEAVAVLATELIEEGNVVGEIQSGYRFKGRLIRPAKVSVAGKPSESMKNEQRED